MTRNRSLSVVVLSALAVAALVLAALLPTYIKDSSVKLTTDFDQTTVLVGTGNLIDRASFQTPTPVRTLTDLPLSISSHTTAESPRSGNATTVKNTVIGTQTDIKSAAGVFIANTDVSNVDRKTYRTLDTPQPTWVSAPSTTPIPETARVGTMFSFAPGVSKKDHPLYELLAHAPVTATYVDDSRVINGNRVYHFRTELAPVDMTQTVGVNQQTQLTLPAFKWGMPGGLQMVTMKQFYANTRDMWVEPTTGATLDTRTQPHTYYARSADDSFTVDTFKADLRFDQNTINTLSDKASDGRTTIRGIFFWLPIGLGVVGVILLLLAVALVTRRTARNGSDRTPPPSTQSTVLESSAS